MIKITHRFLPYFTFIVCLLAICISTGTKAKAAQNQKINLDQQVGQMIMVGFKGTGIEPHDRDFSNLLEAIKQGHLGGIILFDKDAVTKDYGRNILSIQQVAKLTNLLQLNAPIPLFIGIDQEGGRVQRLRSRHGMPEIPTPAAMGMKSSQNTENLISQQAPVLHEAGINLNFAPNLDMNVNPESPAIGALGRSFSCDPGIVSVHANAVINTLANYSIVSCAKHFPGHGSATTDTHNGITDITQTWTPKELQPFIKAMQNPHLGMVMTAHLMNKKLDEKYPASLSWEITTKLLRTKLGWNGVVITDDLQMKAISDHFDLKETTLAAIHAGADILLFGNNLSYDPDLAAKVHSIIMECIKTGEITPERISASYERIIKLKQRI